MNRANFGNIVTNGMQILSVGATTASRLFKKESVDSALNNVTDEERKQHFQIEADRIRERDAKWLAEHENGAGEEFDIDNLIASVSPQSENIQKKVKNDIAWSEKWRNELRNEQKKDVKTTISEVLKENK